MRARVLIALLATAGVMAVGSAAQATDTAPAPAGHLYTAAGWLRGPARGVPTFHDGALATQTSLDTTGGVLELPDGQLLVADGNVIVRVDLDGRIHRFAGVPEEFGPFPDQAEGSPALKTALHDISALARLPDGSILVANEARLVRRIRPDGTVWTAAGLRPPHDRNGVGRPGFSGDGGPATRARLESPVALAVLPDGGFLIADEYGYRVRRVSPDGTISTVAGNGEANHLGDGGPATQAGLYRPVALAVEPDGGFLVAEHGEPEAPSASHVRRVSPDGIITTAAPWPAVGLVSTGDGGFLAARAYSDKDVAHRLVRVDAAGTVTALAGAPHAGRLPTFAGVGNGADPRRARLNVSHIAPAGDGGVYFTESPGGWDSRVRYLAPAQPGRLAIGITPPSLRTSMAMRVSFNLSQPAAVVATASLRGRVVRRSTRVFPAGDHAIGLGRPVAPGRYKVTVTASSGSALPRNAGDSMPIFPGGILTIDAVRRLLRPTIALQFPGPSRIAGCRSMSSARVDCAVRDLDGLCQSVYAFVLRRSGALTQREYVGRRAPCAITRHPPRYKRGSYYAVWPSMYDGY